jgi:hypothetical protein
VALLLPHERQSSSSSSRVQGKFTMSSFRSEAQPSPMRSPSRMIVSRWMPSIRSVERVEQPSVRAEGRLAARPGENVCHEHNV